MPVKHRALGCLSLLPLTLAPITPGLLTIRPLTITPLTIAALVLWTGTALADPEANPKESAKATPNLEFWLWFDRYADEKGVVVDPLDYEEFQKLPDKAAGQTESSSDNQDLPKRTGVVGS